MWNEPPTSRDTGREPEAAAHLRSAVAAASMPADEAARVFFAACARFDDVSMALALESLAAHAPSDPHTSAVHAMAVAWARLYAGEADPADGASPGARVLGAIADPGSSCLSPGAPLAQGELPAGWARALEQIAWARSHRSRGSLLRARQALVPLDGSTQGLADWLAWERVMAGEPEPSAPGGGAAECLVTLLDAVDRGQDQHALDMLQRCTERVCGAAPLLDDLDAIARLICGTDGAYGSGRAPDALTSFVEGRSHVLPDYVLGVTGEAPRAWVVAEPGARGRRVVERALPILARHARFPAPGVLARREASLLAALALAGPDGLDNGAAHTALYGGTYVASTHRAAMDVLVHRVRARAAGVARIERDAGVIRAELLGPTIVWDARCRHRSKH